MRPLCLIAVLPRLRVSIHAPREGCDGRGVGTQQGKEIVSIHAPREGCDSGGHDLGNINLSFNSRTPGGVRQCGAKLRIMGRINKRNLRLEVLL